MDKLTIELRLLDNLHFAYEDVLKGEDTSAGSFDALADRLRDKLFNQISKLAFGSLSSHYAHHLLADCTDLRRPRIARALDLIGSVKTCTESQPGKQN